MARDLQSVLDAVLDGVIVLDEKGRVERANAEACRLLGASAESLCGRELAEIFGPAHTLPRLALGVLDTGRPAIEDEVEIALPKESRDQSIEVDVGAAPLDSDDRRLNGVVVTLRDRTVSKSLRERVDERERLESYGRIAAGIAHEVKNPLGGIRGAAELLGGWAEQERSRSTAGLIVREVDRISSLVDELMVFARRDAMREAPLNIHYVLDRVAELAALDPLGADVPVERFYDPSIPEFLGDTDRLQQVFLNLFRNALQAMEDEGGTLTVTTGMSLEERLADSEGRGVPTVVVTLSDTGPGIPRDTLEQLATPFFTTRSDGTGLGLAVSQHWVARHGGTLRVTSQLGEGTTVRVALPLRREEQR